MCGVEYLWRVEPMDVWRFAKAWGGRWWRDVEDRCCVVHIHVGATFGCGEVNVQEVYWFFNEAGISSFRLKVVFVVCFV